MTARTSTYSGFWLKHVLSENTFIISAADNYFGNQYSTDENSAQPVPADFNQYHTEKV